MKINFSNNELSNLILKEMKFDKKGYWIKQISCEEFDNINGTKIILASKSNKDDFITLSFGDHNISIEGLEEEQKLGVYETFYQVVAKMDSVFAKTYNKFKEDTEKATEDFNKKLKLKFFQSPLLKSEEKPLKLSKNDALVVGEWNHALYYTELDDNKYYSRERDIKVGEVYFANLNPVVKDELGGIRPVLIIGKTKNREKYFIIPFSHINEGEKTYNLNGVESRPCYDAIKQIHAIRIMDKYSEIDKDVFEEIKANICDNHELFCYQLEEKNVGEGIQKSQPVGKEVIKRKPGRPRKQTIETIEPEKTPADEKACVEWPEISKQSCEKFEFLKQGKVKNLEKSDYEMLAKKYAERGKARGFNYLNCKSDKGKATKVSFEENRYNTVAILNKGYSSPKTKYFETRLEFGKNFVAKAKVGDSNLTRDNILTIDYIDCILSKHPYNYLIYLSNLAEFYNSQKHVSIEKNADYFQQNLEDHNINFSGDLKKIIETGSILECFENFSYDSEKEGSEYQK